MVPFLVSKDDKVHAAVGVAAAFRSFTVELEQQGNDVKSRQIRIDPNREPVEVTPVFVIEHSANACFTKRATLDGWGLLAFRWRGEPQALNTIPSAFRDECHLSWPKHAPCFL